MPYCPGGHATPSSVTSQRTIMMLASVFGETVARRLYLWDVARSLLPILEAFIVRISKWAGAAALGEFFRHFVK